MRRTSFLPMLTATVAAIFSAQAQAASWYVSNNLNSIDSAGYFDADSFEKSQDSVKILIKRVKLKEPDADGAWARAVFWEANCAQKSLRPFSATGYDAHDKVLNTTRNLPATVQIQPGSVGESLIALMCSADFPNDPGVNRYFPVKDNDIFKSTKVFLEAIEAQRKNAK